MIPGRGCGRPDNPKITAALSLDIKNRELLLRKIFYGWWIVIACFLIYIYVSGLVYSFTAFFEPISNEFGWSYTKISIAASIRGFELGLFGPIVGFLVDRFGSRKLLFWGTFTLSIGLFLLSHTNSLRLFYFATIIFALGLSACTATVMVPAVAVWFKKDVGKALGIISAGHGVGGLLVPLTVLLISYYQWRITFFISGLGVWLFVIPLVFIVRPKPEHNGTLPDGKAAKTQATPDTEKEIHFTLKEALKGGTFWYLSFAEAIRLMTNTALITHIMPYLSSLGIPRSRAAFVATSIYLLSIIGRLVFGWIGDIFRKNFVMALIYFLAGLSILAFAYAQISWLLITFMILFPFSWGASPLRGAILRESFGVASLGSILGIMAGIGTAARLLGPTLAGWAYDTFGSYHHIWLFFAGTFAVSIFLIIKIKPYSKAPA
jgi:sugar phosphate permease